MLSYGPIGNDVERAIAQLAEDGSALSVAHYDMRFCKPLDTQLLNDIASRFKRVVTVEDGQRAGGFGSAVLEWMNDNGKHVSLQRIGLPDKFIEHGSVAELRKIAGIDTEAIKNAISKTSVTL